MSFDPITAVIASKMANNSNCSIAKYDERCVINIDKYFETPVFNSVKAGTTEFTLSEDAVQEIQSIVNFCFVNKTTAVIKITVDPAFSIYLPLNVDITFTIQTEAPVFQVGSAVFSTDGNNFTELYYLLDTGNKKLFVHGKAVAFG